MNIHYICACSKGFPESEISNIFDEETKVSSFNCRKDIFHLEKAMLDSVNSDKNPDLIIIDKVLDNATENSFRKKFAEIIYRAEKKIQEKPWIEAKKQINQQNKEKIKNKFSRKKSVKDNKAEETINREVAYIKKKTHIFSIETAEDTAYTFAYLNTQILVLPKNINSTEIPNLIRKSIDVFCEGQEKYPEGYSHIEKTHKILTFKEKYIPNKTDNSNEKTRKLIRILACFVFLIAGFMFLNKTVFMPLNNNRSIVEVQSIMYEDTTDPKTGEKVIKTANWKKLKKINKEIIGWIKIKHTKIDYPVVQRKSDSSKSQFYLYHNYKGEPSSYGGIFVDYRSKRGLKSKNVILHGHNMIDGSMFANLVKYGTTEGNMKFYKKAPTIQISTEKGGTETYKIFSIFKSNVNPAQGEYFDFYCSNFKSDSQFMNYVYNLKIRSLINTPVTINEDDQILTLVTCSYEFHDFRTVVVARKCRDGENEKVNTSLASLQKNPLWPQIYYTYRGGTKPEVSTFKKQYDENNISWYDGEGVLDGEEILPTSTEITTPPTTAPKAKKPSPKKKVNTFYNVQIYNHNSLIKIAQVKAKKAVKLPKIKKTYTEDGYKYTFLRWDVKGSSTYKKITQNTVITAVYKKTKATQPSTKPKATKPTTKPAVKPTEKPTQVTTVPETTEPSETQEVIE